MLRPRRHLIALACLSALGLLPGLSLGAATLPSGLQVVQGQAAVSVQGNAMTVRNSNQAILNWQDFSIGNGASVYFAQPSSSSAVLNRVVGQNPSQLFGSLGSNGQVWLLNPNGVLFGAQARVDVAGLVTSTLRLNDADWLAGRWRFSSEAPAAGLVNQGQLRTAQGGRLVLLGGSVRNEGSLEAPGGQVLLAAGQSVELVDTATPHLSLRVRSGPGEVLNLGRLQAAGGTVDVQAAIVNQQGLVSASEMVAGPGGTVRLVASESLHLAAGSRTEADGAQGGRVLADAGAAGQLIVDGRVSATGQAGAGGQVQLLGRQVAVQGEALADVSGNAGGGLMQIGGGEQGRDASVRNSEALFVGSQAQLKADATAQGDGGRIILWSDKATRAFGSFSARGAGLGARGGFVETSGGWLDSRPAKLDLTSPQGRAGLWLIDPYNITISDAVSDNNVTVVAGSYSPNASGSTINALGLAGIMNTGVSVVVDTAGGGAEAGDITVSSATIAGSAGAGNLTLRADRDIIMSGTNITAGVSPFSVTLQAGRGGNGHINISASTINTSGGNITLAGFGGPVAGSGATSPAVSISSSTLNAGSGDLTINATHTGAATGIGAVDLSSVANLSARNISITGSGSAALGINIADATVVGNLSLSLQGSSTLGVGIGGAGGSTLRVINGTLSLSGTGTTGVQLELGESLTGPRLITNNGAINISGTGSGGTGISLSGDNGGEISATGGTVSISTSQNLSFANFDVSVSGAGLTASSGSTLTANSSALHSSAFTQIGANNILLTGTADVMGTNVLLGGTGLSAAAAGFSNGSSFGSGAVTATGGRWIIWTTDSSVLASGGLTQNFTRYSAIAPGQWAGDSGNGFAYSTSATGTLTGTVQSKVYDGTTALTSSGLSISGTPSGVTGTITPGAKLAFADKKVGNNKSLVFNVAGPVVTYTDSSSLPVYGIGTDASSLVANITPASLVVSGLTAKNKVYDGGVTATLQGTPSITPLGSDVVTLKGTATGSFTNKNVGNGIAVGVSGLSLSGPDGGNYTLSFGSLSANISPATLLVSGLKALDRPYDATTVATFGGTASVTPLGSDSVSLSGTPTGNFSSKNVGSNLPVSWGGLSLVGADAGNYLLSYPALSASITPRPLSLGGLTAQDKVYDGTTAVSLTGQASATPLAGDNVTVSGQLSASFVSKNVGSSVDVTVSGLSLAGADAGNYTLGIAPLRAAITPRSLALTGLTARDKVYDASTTASLSGSAAISALAGDVVSLSGSATARFADATAGSGKPVQLTGLSLSGGDASNYSLTLPSLSATINPATLRYVANPAQMTSGQPLPVLTGSVTGFVASETQATATTGTLSFTTTATPGAPPGLYPITGGGLSAQNYRFEQDPANATALSLAGLPPVLQSESGATQSQAALQPPSPTGSTGNVASTVAAITPGSSVPSKPLTGVVDIVASAPVAVSTGTPTSSAQAPSTPSTPSTTSTSSSTASSITSATAVSSALAAASSSAETQSFQPVVLSSLTDSAKSSLLAARQAYKEQLFAQAVQQLERNPGLADLPACVKLEDALAGRCLVTDSLRRQLAGQVPVKERLTTPTAPAPAAATAPTAPTAPATAPVAAAAPATALVTAPVAVPVTPTLGERRRVRTAALPQIERKVALVIGVDAYADARIPKLQNAVRDASAMAALFEGQLGYETLLLANPDRATLVAALNRLALVLKPSDSVVVYYAGHGELVESTRQGYWQLADADPQRPETWLSNADISRLVAALPAAQVALVSDSCYSGSLVAEERIRASQAPIDPIALLTRKTVVVMSSGGNEPVFDAGKNGHSPFAYNLMAQLSQVPDWRPGGQVFERVRFAVARELPQRPQYGASSSAGHQRGGDYLFEQRRLEK